MREGGGAANAWRASLVVTLRRVLSIEALLPEFNRSGTAAPSRQNPGEARYVTGHTLPVDDGVCAV